MRTTKRHFSTMSQYWKWLKPLGHVDNIIFSGFSFPGTKGGKKKRDDWSRADLNLFLESDWYTSRASDCAERWLPLIAQIGRAHVCTPVTNAKLVCRLLLETQKTRQQITM